MTKLNKITYHKLELKDVIENNSKFYKKYQDKKLRIKRIRIKVDIFINQRTILKISMGSVVSKIRREKSGRRRKKSLASIHQTSATTRRCNNKRTTCCF